MNLPNKITLSRIALIPFFLIILLGSFFDETTSRMLATVVFIIASATDALDGYIARSRNLVTTFGKFADPLADKLLVASALIAMVQLGDLSAVVVVIIISREFIVTGFRVVAASENVVIAASIWGKIKTNLQMLMIIYFLLGLDSINSITSVVGLIIIIITVIATIFSAVDYIYKNKDLLKGAM